MSLWDSVAGLELRVDGYGLERHESQTPSGWSRVTTVVEMDGDEVAGLGEDVTYEAESHDGVPSELMLAGTWKLEDFSLFLDRFEELAEGYRRWAFESAALDLALRQNGLGLGEALDRPEQPDPLRRVHARRSRALARRSHRTSSSSSTRRRTGIATSSGGSARSTASASST